MTPPKTWNRDRLTLTALYYPPALTLARAQAQSADAAIKTPAHRPNPRITISVKRKAYPELKGVLDS
ncbi:MAG: hypothetical protein ACR65R_01755 [Methylomicrobium sp.]